MTTGVNLTLFRAYDPELGRWLSRDPMEEEVGLNLYSYVDRNPVNFIDPMGLCSSWKDYIDPRGPEQAALDALKLIIKSIIPLSARDEAQLDAYLPDDPDADVRLAAEIAMVAAPGPEGKEKAAQEAARLANRTLVKALKEQIAKLTREEGNLSPAVKKLKNELKEALKRLSKKGAHNSD